MSVMRIWSCVVFVSYVGGCSWSGRWGGARAVNEITTQECVAALGVDNEAAAGYTGKGVGIAVIDGACSIVCVSL